MGVRASPSASGRAGTAAWLVVGLLWIVALLNYLDRQLVTTMGKPIKAELVLGDTPSGRPPQLVANCR
jgi:hypothetical protein